ncbi:MAG TPA: hypothetical protein VMR33_22485 [Candidatus Baltobacteraceae bacterium]|jgi:hypothetical protein|nr:hypothetical protein [Candidatus Baltobacteraceae bacterium]
MADPSITIPGITTTVSVLLVAWQLLRTHRQSVTVFEDSLAREYRELTAKIPTKAFLEGNLTEQEYEANFDKFYRYFDLSNEQAFLHEKRRVRGSTWKFWKDGIASNLKRPAFKRAWNEVCEKSSDFAELRAHFPPATVPDGDHTENNRRQASPS